MLHFTAVDVSNKLSKRCMFNLHVAYTKPHSAGVKANRCVIHIKSRHHKEAWRYTWWWWCLCVFVKVFPRCLPVNPNIHWLTVYDHIDAVKMCCDCRWLIHSHRFADTALMRLQWGNRGCLSYKLFFTFLPEKQHLSLAKNFN